MNDQALSDHSSANKESQQKSSVQIRLLKGPVYRQRHKDVWQWLERDQYQIREYFQQIGLSLSLDEAEGYAFLKQIDNEQEASPQQEIPRLITRRSLPFDQSLLLVLVRKRLAEHDSEESAPRLIIQRAEIHQWLQPYFQAENNEIKQQKVFDALIKKICDLGFLSPLRNYPDDFEVQRIIKAFIDAEHIAAQLAQLEEYARQKIADQEE